MVLNLLFNKWIGPPKKLEIQPLVRFVSELRVINYGDCTDRLDEHLQLLETVANEEMKAFCIVVVSTFRNQYLNRAPTPAEKQCLLHLTKKRGFPGCFASYACKHYLWRNFPTCLAGQHKGKDNEILL